MIEQESIMNINIFRNTISKLQKNQYFDLLKKHKQIESGIKFINEIYLDACKILNIHPVGQKQESPRLTLLSESRFKPYTRDNLLNVWNVLSKIEKEIVSEGTENKDKQESGEIIWSNIKQLAFDTINKNK